MCCSKNLLEVYWQMWMVQRVSDSARWYGSVFWSCVCVLLCFFGEKAVIQSVSSYAPLQFIVQYNLFFLLLRIPIVPLLFFSLAQHVSLLRARKCKSCTFFRASTCLTAIEFLFLFLFAFPLCPSITLVQYYEWLYPAPCTTGFEL